MYFDVSESESFCFNSNLISSLFIFHYRCRFWHRSIGALSVWLSWLSLVLFMRKFPKLGIYVVMFTDILKTFAQFFLVFCLFIVAFGLGFHMLLFEQVDFSFLSQILRIYNYFTNIADLV